MTQQGSSAPLSKPPEGVICGESVPKGSEPDNYDEQKIKEVMHSLKARGEVFRKMSEDELRERAIEFCHRHGVDI